jgi:hypothetical protein
MNLSFQEKSAWGLLAGILVVSAFYFPAALRIIADTGHPVPLIVVSAVGVAAIVVIETVYHVVIAVSGDTQVDERDRFIDLKAERNGGFALGLALVSLVGHIVLQYIRLEGQGPNALTLAIYIIGAMTVAECVKLISQIWYYRTDAL